MSGKYQKRWISAGGGLYRSRSHGMSLFDRAGGAHFECAPHFELLKLTTRCRFSGDLLSANVVQSQLEIAA